MGTETENDFVVFAKPFIDFTILICLIGYLIWHFWNRRAPGSPPGTNGLPLLGAITSLRAFPEQVMAKWTKKYGPVCMVKMGFLDVVIIGSLEAANEAFVKSSSFGDRPHNAVNLFSKGYGILMLKGGNFHTEQRRFGLKALREFGMGRRSLEPTLVDVSNDLCERLDALCDHRGRSAPTKLDLIIYDTISHIISHLVFGYKVSQHKEEFRDLLREMVQPSKTHVLHMIMLIAPFVQSWPLFRQEKRKMTVFRNKLHRLLSVEIDEHRKSRDPGNPRDFVDFFLDELEKAERQQKDGEAFETQNVADNVEKVNPEAENNPGNPDEEELQWKPMSSFCAEQLLQLTKDLFVAATDTTSNTLLWLISFLSTYPDVQRRMQRELDDVFGQSGVITMRLIEKLPYFRAVLQEVHRHRPAVPLSLPHLASRSDYLMGYRIPKGAMLLTNLYGMHHDPARFPDPDQFKPERHLDSDGRFVKSPYVLPFNVGSRSCLGRQLAKMQLFIVSASLLRRFDFALAPGENPDLRGTSMVTLRPPTFDIVLSKRQ